MEYKVIYLDRKGHDTSSFRSPKDGDGFFTYGWGGISARQFKKYFPYINVECWKAVANIKKIYNKKIQGVSFFVFPSIYINKFGHYSFLLEKYLKKQLNSKEKIVFNIQSCSHLLCYRIANLLKNHPLICQSHGEPTIVYRKKQRKGIKKIKAYLEAPFEKKAFGCIDAYFAIDERVENYLPNFYDRKKVIIQTMGVDENMFPVISKSEARSSLSLELDKKYLLYVGFLSLNKRTDILLNVYKRIKMKYPNVKLLIAGNTKNDVFYTQTKKLGAIIYGVILQTELYKLLCAADVYILPKYSQGNPFMGIGMLPVQALLCNTPIVGESIRNAPKEIRNKIGIYADNVEDIQEAILKILEKRVSFGNLRDIAIQYYSWNKITMNTKLIYDNLYKQYYF